MKTLPVLIKAAKALQKKAEQASEKADQYWISLGEALAELKRRKPPKTTWPVFVKEHFDYSQQRADELISIAAGRTTVEAVREGRREGHKRMKANPPLASGGSKKGNGSSANLTDQEIVAQFEGEEAANAMKGGCDYDWSNPPVTDFGNDTNKMYKAQAEHYITEAKHLATACPLLNIPSSKISASEVKAVWSVVHAWQKVAERIEQRHKEHENAKKNESKKTGAVTGNQTLQ